MICTTDKAAGKFCVLPTASDESPIPMCVGEACMAWRWFDVINDDGNSCSWKPTNKVMRHTDDTKDKPLDQRRGYCGLAGAP